MEGSTVQLGDMLDITAPKGVQVQIRADGKVLWVNVDGKCVLRCCQIEVLDVDDARPDLCAGCGFQECQC
jgi:hypothetical protein